MKFQLLDSLTLPGNPSKPNDDAMAHDEHAGVVFDGATGLGENLMPGNSDAAWLATFGSRRLLAHLREGDTPKDAARAAMQDAQKSYEALRRRAPKARWEIPFASMMLACANAKGANMLWFGDCAALVKRPDAPAEVVGVAFDARAQESGRVAKLAAKHGLAPAAGINRPEYLEALRKARSYTNTEKGHYIFAPDPIGADHASEQKVVAPAGTVFLLCSDGFLALASDYGAYTPQTLIDAAQNKGLKKLGEELRAIEADDSDGRKFPRFKTSDDATALLLRLI
jgi:hypothetical protein